MKEHTTAPAVQRDGLDPAARIVWDFLAALGARDLVAAGRFLADDFVMVFPGPTVFRDLNDLVPFGARYYRRVAKRFHRFDVCPGDGETIVYNSGVLFGEWNDGRPFDDIRYVDRFVVSQARIVHQEVWNDLAAVALGIGVHPSAPTARP